MTGVTLPAGCLCLFTGAMLGGVFLGLKLLGLLLRGGRLFTFFSDLLFGLICALAAFVVALAVDSGRLRMFQAALQCLGAWGTIVALDPLLSGVAARLRRVAGRLGGAVRQRTGRLLPKRKPRQKTGSRRKAPRKPGRQGRKQRLGVKRQKNPLRMLRLSREKPSSQVARK